MFGSRIAARVPKRVERWAHGALIGLFGAVLFNDYFGQLEDIPIYLRRIVKEPWIDSNAGSANTLQRYHQHYWWWDIELLQGS
jgi:hypothetical protein